MRVRGPCTPSTRIELDVAGGGGAGDQRVRAGRVEPAKASDRSAATWSGADDDQVEVGHQGKRAAALGRAVVQDDRAGLGDGHGAAGDDAGSLVELGGGQRRGVAG